LTARPGAADAAFAEGVKAYQAGRPGEAEAAFRRAIKKNAKHWRAQYLLGIALHQQGRNDQAAEAIAAAQRLEPRNAEIAANLGVVQRAAGKRPEAIAAFRQALALDPKLVAVQRQLAATLFDVGELTEAEGIARQAVEAEPGHAEGLTTFATILVARRAHADAERLFRSVIASAPGQAEAHNGLGVALRVLGRNVEAIACFMKAAALRPVFGQAYVNLAAALTDEGRPAEAVQAAIEAVRLMPDLAEAHSNHGNALKDLGRVSEAIMALRRALALDPGLAAVHSNLIFALDYDVETPWAEALAERRRWNDRFTAALTRSAAPHDNDADPDRRLRVGYVSADFRRHSASLVLAPPILAHDPGVIDVVCYSSVRSADDVTATFRAKAVLWRDVADLGDQELAIQIRKDRIDILVDLSGHSGGNRLLAFARKPAPVQITAWGYAAGTGLEAMDWIISDAVVAPEDEKPFHEKPLRLPAYLCFAPPTAAPAIAPAPCGSSANFVLGFFNRIAKLSDVDVDAQARILRKAPQARILFKDRAFDAAEPRERLRKQFEVRGVEPSRLEFLGSTSQVDQLTAYAGIDLALDPLGYGGGVSAMEALWMGVPVLTCRGDRPSLRGAASMLSAMGLEAFIAKDADEYVAKALARTADPAPLISLRNETRHRLAISPHMQAGPYARAVEAAYRRLWRDWCARRNVSMLGSA